MKVKIICLSLAVVALLLGLGICRISRKEAVSEPQSKMEVKKLPEKAQPSEKEDTKTEKIETDESGKVWEELLKESFADFDGTLSLNFHLYNSDYRFTDESPGMKSASVIKLFIMEYVYHLAQTGEISMEDTVEGRKLSHLVESMITVSDNNSTNVLIDRFTMEKLNEFFALCGYTDTILARRMLDTAAAARGEENYTSAKDVMAFLDKLYNNKDTYPYSEMLSVMKRQQISTKFRRDMPQGVEMASKTGELSDTENDVAIVFTPNGDYALVCLTGGGTPSVARNSMAKVCKAIYDELQ